MLGDHNVRNALQDSKGVIGRMIFILEVRLHNQVSHELNNGVFVGMVPFNIIMPHKSSC